MVRVTQASLLQTLRGWQLQSSPSQSWPLQGADCASFMGNVYSKSRYIHYETLVLARVVTKRDLGKFPCNNFGFLYATVECLWCRVILSFGDLGLKGVCDPSLLESFCALIRGSIGISSKFCWYQCWYLLPGYGNRHSNQEAGI